MEGKKCIKLWLSSTKSYQGRFGERMKIYKSITICVCTECTCASLKKYNFRVLVDHFEGRSMAEGVFE